MASLAEVRHLIGDHYAPLLPTDVAVLVDAPATLVAPALVVLHDDPWIERVTIGPGLSASVRLRLVCIGGAAGLENAGALARTEDLVTACLLGLPDGVVLENVAAPERMPIGAGDMLGSTIRVRATVTLTDEGE